MNEFRKSFSMLWQISELNGILTAKSYYLSEDRELLQISKTTDSQKIAEILNYEKITKNQFHDFLQKFAIVLASEIENIKNEGKSDTNQCISGTNQIHACNPNQNPI